MENNLKFALDETDDEMTHFAGRNQAEKKKITTEIIYVIKNVIIPFSEENTIMRKKLQPPNKMIDELNNLILDLTTKNKSKISENKILIRNKN